MIGNWREGSGRGRFFRTAGLVFVVVRFFLGVVVLVVDFAAAGKTFFGDVYRFLVFTVVVYGERSVG